MYRDLTVITLEEHYGDSELADSIGGNETGFPEGVLLALRDLGDARLRAMDDAGIDMQVVSPFRGTTKLWKSLSRKCPTISLNG